MTLRYALYYPTHFLGIFMTFMCIGAMCIYCKNGGSKEDNPSRKFLAIIHGIGLLLLIIGGMGLMKATGAAANGFPTWILIKLCVWIIVGMSSMVIYKKPQFSTLWFFLYCSLGVFAGLTAKFKSLDYFLSLFK
jgi:uncharacterized membrane protein SirB2